MKRAMAPAAPNAPASTIRLGISQCLLGEHVRFDGGHKRDQFLVDVLAPHVEWVPVCPELEAGLGVPREPIRLVGSSARPKIATVTTGVDLTRTMERFSDERVRELADLELSGYVFKKDSPSCGVERVRVYDEQGHATRTGAGVFARAFMKAFPLTPVEEEGRLNDVTLRENFIERVFAYRRWQDLVRSRVTRGRLVEFHRRHKFLLLAHSRAGYESLGRLVGHATSYSLGELADRYADRFMETLRIKATVRKHVNVLHHAMGHLRPHLTAPARAEILTVIDDYGQRLVPLIVPVTLITHYVHQVDVPYLREQIYLHPHPKELMLRNHV